MFKADGNFATLRSLFHLFSSLAKSQRDRGVGADFIPTEVYKSLPFMVHLSLLKLFRDLHAGRAEKPDTWRNVHMIGAPKTGYPESFDEYRWLSKLCAMQRLYSRAIGLAAREQSSFTRPNMSAYQAIAIIFEAVYFCDVWGIPLVISAQDVQAAHDHVLRRDHAAALQSDRWHPRHVLASVLLYQCSTCSRAIPGVGECDRFAYDICVFQGDPESARIFDAIVGGGLDDLEKQWTISGYGFVLSESQKRLLHVRLADNIFLFATSKAHLTCMIVDLSHLFADRNVIWKSSYLHVLTCGAQSHDTQSLEVTIGEREYVWIATSKLDALGTCIDSKASSSVLLMHRLRSAEKIIWQRSKLLSRLGSPASSSCKHGLLLSIHV
eukprot:TRINITY_DN9367_c0_g1_i1.p1 TRINITY_DN9367_c0_g1~~TRINITY_DN9367_c0_g1_i1.p1  ORF type:complete len:435 (-),score=38.98 TRINITY_DN9367_c0_g1_i1:1403-2545(-)